MPVTIRQAHTLKDKLRGELRPDLNAKLEVKLGNDGFRVLLTIPCGQPEARLHGQVLDGVPVEVVELAL